ncbi:MAG TPA: BTAD domain-containing putative transcriptional regulator [Gemmatimonadaceae bacterium]
MIHLRLLGGVELTVRDSGRERRLMLPPKPLALLAFLAVAEAEGRPVRRDVLLALFWPELESTRARAALRQALHQLRRGVGQAAVDSGRDVITLSPEAIACDLVAFERCLAQGDRAGAMEIYRGPLLQGFFIDGASSELEGWIEKQRAQFASKAFLACSALADEAVQTNNGIAAAQWARRAVSLAPDNEIAVRRLIEILDNFGDRAGALRVAGDFARWLSDEFGAAPSAGTQALIAAIRSREATPPAIEPAPVAVSQSLITPTPPEPREDLEAIQEDQPTRRAPSRRRGVLAAATVTAMVAGGIMATRTGRGATPNATDGATSTSPPITVASPIARRLYTEGTDRFFAGDVREAARLLDAALAEDSSCAMCAYYGALAYRPFDDVTANRMFAVAMRLSDRVSEPERLLIHYRWADVTNSVQRSVVADSLVRRYSYWSEAQMAAAEAENMQAHWLAAAEHLRRAIAAQLIPSSTGDDACSVCSARLFLVDLYSAADSLPAALRVAEVLVRTRPHSRPGWLSLSHVLAESGRYDEARAAIDTSTRYASGTDADVIEHAQIEIRAGNYDVADRLLTTMAQTGNGNSRFDALWYKVISLRAQGRLREALETADGPMRTTETASTEGVGESEVADAQVRFELGQYRRSAELFASQSFPRDSFSVAALGRVARQRAWTLTHAGTALAAAGDTVGLAALVDTVKSWGAQSGFGRDRLLHHYLRGLLWMARGRPDSAVTAFRLAMLSETQGYSRINLELGRALLLLGRADEAIPVLEHSLAGTLEAGNFYVARTEIQEAVARAFEAAGRPDSAAIYYKEVLRAWRHADPQFQPAIERARSRLATDERLLATRH